MESSSVARELVLVSDYASIRYVLVILLDFSHQRAHQVPRKWRRNVIVVALIIRDAPDWDGAEKLPALVL